MRLAAVMVSSQWLTLLSWTAVGSGIISALWIAADVMAGHRQRMTIMNVVWPLTALYSGPLGLWAYYRVGRAMAARTRPGMHEPGQEREARSLAAAAAIGTTHCGSGCCLGDIAAEWLLLAFPLVLFGRRIFGAWLVDYVLAYLFGIAFQYFTIKPMRKLSTSAALWAAVKADTASLTAWQLGMYGWMAIATFVIFGHELDGTSPVFWFMMQIGMLAGFLTSWPVNAWLIRKGLKEPM